MVALSVVIPSTFRELQDGGLFLEKAVKSIRDQTSSIEVKVIVGVNNGAVIPDVMKNLGVVIAEGDKATLTSAINAATDQIEGDFVAFLEDDDWWCPKFLETALAALTEADFVSSTQLEVTEAGEVIRINDFPTPSGWVMHRRTWEAVGNFSHDYTIHQDNDWLGRLAMTRLSRLHLVEATAPVDVGIATVARPWLANVHIFSGKISQYRRHSSPWPLVNRTVHSQSAMAELPKSKSAQNESDRCVGLLLKRYDRIPW